MPPAGSAVPVAIPPHVAGTASVDTTSRISSSGAPQEKGLYYPQSEYPGVGTSGVIGFHDTPPIRTSVTKLESTMPSNMTNSSGATLMAARATPPLPPLGVVSESIRRSQERLIQSAAEHEAANNTKLKIPAAREIAGSYVKKAVDHLYGKNSVESQRAQDALNLAISDDPAAQKRYHQKYGRCSPVPLLRGKTSFDLRTRIVPVVSVQTPDEPCQPVYSQSGPVPHSVYPPPYQSYMAFAVTTRPESVISSTPGTSPVQVMTSATSVVTDPNISRIAGLAHHKLVTNSASVDSIHTASGLKPMPSLSELMNAGKLSYNESVDQDLTRYKSDTHLLAPPAPKRLSYTASLSKIHEDIAAQSQETKPSRPICTPWIQNGVQSGRSAIQAAKRAFLIQAGLLDKESLEPVSPPFTTVISPTIVTQSKAQARQQFLGMAVTDKITSAPAAKDADLDIKSLSAQEIASIKKITHPVPELEITPPAEQKEKVKPPLRKQMTTPELRTPISRSAIQLDLTPQLSDEDRIAALRLVQQRQKQFEVCT